MGEEQKEKPNMVARLGQVLYWIGSSCAALSALAIWWVLVYEVKHDSNEAALLALAVGIVAWLAGFAARYILKGDIPRWPDKSKRRAIVILVMIGLLTSLVYVNADWLAGFWEGLTQEPVFEHNPL